jgi:flagellar export protein FliJ
MLQKSFTFKLEPVRALREQVEKQAQEALAHELELERRSQADVAEAAVRVELARAAGVPDEGAAVTGHDLLAHQAYVERVEREKTVAEEGLAAQERQVDAGRSRLVEASREHEVLVRLKQRRRTEHDQELARAQGAALDEIAITRHLRRSLEAA